MSNRRLYPGLRAHIEEMLVRGWKITSRSPVRLEHAGRVMEVIEGVLSNG